MRQIINNAFFAIIMGAAVLGTGCASKKPVPVQQPATAEQLYKDAVQALDAGQREKGLQLLDESARANPAYAEPWIKAAQVYFDAENYPSAIESADEAMKRDPSRRETKAIAVVASLRVAVRALADMSEDTNLRGNTRSEAERLARTLRETLGQDVLVPVSDNEPRNAPARRPASPAVRPVPRATPPEMPQPIARPVAPQAPSGASPSNPFSILK